MSANYAEWDLGSIYRRDDVDRLQIIFTAITALADVGVAKDLALKTLLDVSRKNAPRCSNWLAQTAAAGRPSLNPPALHTALANRNLAAAKFLARHSLKREIAAIADGGLFLAASEDDSESLEIFIPHVNVNKANASGHTALMVAAAHGSVRALNALLPLSKREQRDNGGFNALMHAISRHNEDALIVLLRDASAKEITGQASGNSAIELARDAQNKNIQFGLNPETARHFRPHEMVKARLEAIEISQVSSEAMVRADDGASKNKPRKTLRV
ncbi:ankyrin repeat domain-containing protein [Paraburkholderia tropica]|uniref:ankyrin repeat domain-containing protein n=1 Tax=Paraburkholderia tropica TaxID=92647 RepID=UPI002AB0D0D3|nr:ankyrin repeat domain-containing protein [Paraburkholderia tropica]